MSSDVPQFKKRRCGEVSENLDFGAHVAPRRDANYAGAYAERGVCIVEYALETADIEALESVAEHDAAGHRIAIDEMRVTPTLFGALDKLSALAARLAAQHVTPIRAVAFDKTPDANWFVPWHQDRTVRLAIRTDAAKFKNWTEKDGSSHAEAPVELLEGMITLRVALDDCDPENGPLEVLPGSHRAGVLSRPEIDAQVTAASPKVCLMARGDILAMSPLLVHRSQRALKPTRRRVLHIEFLGSDNARALPSGLAFAH